MIVYLHPNSRKDLVAQLAEHLPFKERVLGSSPSQVTTTKSRRSHTFDFFFLRTYRGAGIGRQAWLRAMCPLGRVGSTPILGTRLSLR